MKSFVRFIAAAALTVAGATGALLRVAFSGHVDGGMVVRGGLDLGPAD